MVFISGSVIQQKFVIDQMNFRSPKIAANSPRRRCCDAPPNLTKIGSILTFPDGKIVSIPSFCGDSIVKSLMIDDSRIRRIALSLNGVGVRVKKSKQRNKKEEKCFHVDRLILQCNTRNDDQIQIDNQGIMIKLPSSPTYNSISSPSINNLPQIGLSLTHSQSKNLFLLKQYLPRPFLRPQRNYPLYSYPFEYLRVEIYFSKVQNLPLTNLPSYTSPYLVFKIPVPSMISDPFLQYQKLKVPSYCDPSLIQMRPLFLPLMKLTLISNQLFSNLSSSWQILIWLSYPFTHFPAIIVATFTSFIRVKYRKIPFQSWGLSSLNSPSQQPSELIRMPFPCLLCQSSCPTQNQLADSSFLGVQITPILPRSFTSNLL